MATNLENIDEMVSNMNHNQITRAIYYRDCRIEALTNALGDLYEAVVKEKVFIEEELENAKLALMIKP